MARSPKSNPDATPQAIHPREAESLAGHDDAVRTLASAFASGRLAHAWLICGPRGIGKATLAYRFARHVLAAGGAAGGTADGLFDAAEAPAADALHVAPDSAVFRRIASRSHADLAALELEINEKTNKLRTEITVEQVRRLIPFFGKTAGEGGWRVAIIDSCDLLNRSAANALLKVLEEPPQRGLLLLIAHAPGRLLPTLRSRCRKLTLGPLEDAALARVLEQSLPGVSEADRLALARVAEGSPGRALELEAGGGLGLYGEMVDLFRPLPGLDIAGLHALGDRLARRGAEGTYRTLTGLMIHWIERLIRNAAGAAPTPEVVSGEHAIMQALAARRSLEDWIEVWDKVRRLVARADAVNLDRKQVVLNIFSAVDQAARG